MNLFGKKKKTVVNSNVAITQLHDTLELLTKRENHLEKQIEKFRQDAIVAYKSKKISRAKQLLVQSKTLDKQLRSVFGMKTNVETQLLALSQTLFNQEAFKAIQTSRDVLKNVETEIDPDRVADTMDELEEVMLNMTEVTDTLSRPLGQTDVNDDELMKELESELFEQEQLVVPELQVPNVPTTPLTKETKESQELQELQNLMA